MRTARASTCLGNNFLLAEEPSCGFHGKPSRETVPPLGMQKLGMHAPSHIARNHIESQTLLKWLHRVICHVYYWWLSQGKMMWICGHIVLLAGKKERFRHTLQTSCPKPCCCCVVLCCIVLCCIVLCCIVLCCIVLCCIVLCFIVVLCCIVLCCTWASSAGVR